MAKTKIFFSFHYDNDVWRTQIVRHIPQFDRDIEMKPTEWEEIKKKPGAVEKWIDEQISSADGVIFLIGSETANRKYCKQEFKVAIEKKKPTCEIFIHKLEDKDGKFSTKGQLISSLYSQVPNSHIVYDKTDDYASIKDALSEFIDKL